ncbi:MAG: hypothetical protein ACTHK7_12240 [Aureliella sp.]
MNREPAYQHTQRAPLCLLLYALAALEFLLAAAMRNEPAMLWLFVAVGVLVLVLAAAFHYLRVVGLSDRLLIGFGPLPLFRRTVKYADIAGVAVGRTSWLDGWGIHWRWGRGWVWNIWGRNCVVLRFKHGALRIGSDDAEQLAAFLQERTQPPAA